MPRGHHRWPPALVPDLTQRSSSAALGVLVVEDETLVSMLLVDLVEDAGFVPVGTAVTAEEALRLAAAERPSIAIVDVNLQGARDGLAVAARLSRLGIAIILTSGHTDIGAWPEVRTMNPAAVLPKPCTFADVARVLRDAAQFAPATPEPG